jgi:hypothetical protein
LFTVWVVGALAPKPTIDALAAIDRGLPLRERLTIAADLFMQRFAEHSQLLSAVRKLIMMGDQKEHFQKMAHDRERTQAALTELIEPDAAILRRSPASTARLLLLYCGARMFGPFGDPDGFDSQEAVSLLLDGLLIRQDDNRGAQSTC